MANVELLFERTFILSHPDGAPHQRVDLARRIPLGQDDTTTNGRQVLTRLYHLPSEAWLLIRLNVSPEDRGFDRAWWLSREEAELWQRDRKRLELYKLHGWFVRRGGKGALDIDGWKRPFQTLREQFLQAHEEPFCLALHLTTFTHYRETKRWFDERIDGPMKRAAESRGTQSRVGIVCGDQLAVERFCSLAAAAGSALPISFRPPRTLFPSVTARADWTPEPVTVWGDFLFVAGYMHFSVEEDWPVPGCRLAKLHGCPFLTSALAIDRRLLGPSEPNETEFQRDWPLLCPWAVPPSTETDLVSAAAQTDTPNQPQGMETSGTAAPEEKQTPSNKATSAPSPTSSVSRQEPSPDAIKAYRLQLANGYTQTKLAEEMTSELKRPVTQGTVSRWLKQVRQWLKAGNVLPDLLGTDPPKTVAMDPERIELGKRSDGRASRQRPKRSDDHDS